MMSAAAEVTPDPGWILSTCATAAATLLAIVGGFLVAQLIALVSDQHVADARLTDARGAQEQAQATLAAATAALRAAVTPLLLSDQALAALVAVRGTVGPAEAERTTDGSALLDALPADLRAQSIGCAVSQLTELRDRAAHALILIVPVAEHPDSWERFKWAHFRIKPAEDALWRAMYQIIAGQREIEAAELNGHPRPRPAGSALIDVTSGASAAAHSAPAAAAAAQAEEEAREALAAWRQAVQAADQTSAVAAQALQRRRELIPLTQFKYGVGVLAYLAAAVVFPLAVLASGPGALSVLSRVLVPSSLALGVAFLIAFFVYLSRRTRQPAVSLLLQPPTTETELRDCTFARWRTGRAPFRAGHMDAAPVGGVPGQGRAARESGALAA
jgi:hypothetical protein